MVEDHLCRTTVVHPPKHLRKMVEDHLCRTGNVCHQSIYLRKSSNHIPGFQVACRFPSISATALVGLSVTFRCGAVLTTLCELIYYRPVSFPECCCAGLRIFSPVHAVHGALSFSPEIPKTHRRQFRVANRMLNVAMAEISLQGSGVMPFVGQCVAAGVPEHMWMSLEPQTCFSASPPNHACEPCGAEGCSSLRREHEWRLRLLLTLKAPQGS